MKVMNLLTVFLLLITFSISGMAQPAGQDYGKREFKKEQRGPNIPDLSDEQKGQIKNLRIPNKKAMNADKNRIGELQAKLKTLQTADNVDMNKINSTIEEISVIKTQMEKRKAAHHQAIRSLLTDEQRVVFDSRPMGKGKGNRQEHGKGRKGRH